MSQQDLATALGYKSRSTVAKIEAGEVGLSYRKLVDFSRALGITVDELTENDQAQEKTPRTIPTVAVVLAGGTSSRNAEATPNQFLVVDGKPVIIYCLETYQEHPSIDDIYVVCLKGWERELSNYAKKFGITKLKGIVPGGSTGMNSIFNAIQALKDSYPPETTIILQESTRPMVSAALISKLLVNCKEQGSGLAYRSMEEFVQFTLDDDGDMRYVNRDRLYEIESPEAYPLNVIVDALEEAARKGIALDDTCLALLLHRLGYTLRCFESNSNNIKIVRQEDLLYFKSLLNARF